MLQTMPSDPIVEAIFDIRFNCPNNLVSSLILGSLYSTPGFKERFPTKSRLPAADLPAVMRQADPKLRYQPEYRIQGEREAILIGNFNLAITVQEPYPGWKHFKPKILETLDIINNIDEQLNVIRVAFRYINLLQSDKESTAFDQLNFDGRLGEFDLKQHNTSIGLELKVGDIDHTVRVNSNATLTNTLNQTSKVGTLLDIDTSRSIEETDFWADKEEIIENVRVAERDIFESLMEQSALNEFKNHE